MYRTLLGAAVLCAGLWVPPAAALPYVYVTDPGNGGLYAIDAATNTIVRQLSALGGARAVAVGADGTRAYVAESGAGAVAVIDPGRLANTGLNPVIGTLNVGGKPVALALGPFDRYLYVADAATDQVEAFDLGAGKPFPVAAYPGDPGLVDVAISPDGRALALASTSADRIAFYNLRHLVNGAAVRTDVALPSAPAALAFSDDGSTLWIATATGFSSYDPATGQVTSHVVSGGTDAVAYAARADTLYFGSATADVVYAYDPAGATTTPIGVSGVPAGLAVSPDGTRAYAVQNCAGCGLAVIDTARRQAIAQVTFGQSPATTGRFAGPGFITAENDVASGVSDQQLAGQVSAADGRLRALAYSVIAPPASGQLVMDGSGHFVYTPASGASGVNAFVWQAAAASGPGSPTDPVSRPVTETLVVAPSLSAFASQTVAPGAVIGPLDFTLDGTRPITVTVASDNAAVVDPATAVIGPGCGTSLLACTLTLSAGTAAGESATVTVTATDPDYVASQQTFTVTIRGGGAGGGGAFSLLVLPALAVLLLLRRRRGGGDA